MEMILPAGLDAAELLQPSKEALDFPAPPVAPKRSAILGEVLARAAMGGDHFYPVFGKLGIEAVGVIGVIANEAPNWLRNEDFRQSLLHQSHFVRGRTPGANGDRKAMALCDGHELGALAPLGFAHSGAPFFAGLKVPSM